MLHLYTIMDYTVLGSSIPLVVSGSNTVWLTVATAGKS